MKLIKLVWILIASPLIHAQSGPNIEEGIKPFSSYSASNIDTVNLANLNVTIHIPLMSFPQRGNLTLAYSVVANNKPWQLTYLFGPPQFCSWPDGVWGDDPCTYPPPYTYAEVLDPYSDTPSPWGAHLTTSNSYSAALTSYQMPPMCQLGNGGYQCFPSLDATNYQTTFLQNPEGQWEEAAVTSSGFLSQSGDGLAASADGVVWDRKGNGYGGDGGAADVYGNQITKTSSGTIDTRGLFIPDPSWQNSVNPSCPVGTNSSQVWNVPEYAGATQPYYLCYEQLTVSTAYPMPPGGQAPGNPFPGYTYENGQASLQFLVGVVLPNQTKWAFTYTSWGEVSSVTLPTGARITYNWITSTCSSPSPKDWQRLLQSRTEYDPSTGRTGTWSFGQDGAVTDPLGNVSKHFIEGTAQLGCFKGMLGAVETRVEYYDSSAPTKLLKSVDTSYAVMPVVNNQGGNTAGYGAKLPQTITTTLDDGSVTKVTKAYDQLIPAWGNIYDNGYTPMPAAGDALLSVGDVLQETVYDYGSTSPTRTDINSWLWISRMQAGDNSYVNSNLIDLIDGKQVRNGNGTVVSQETVGYDDTSQIVPTTGVPHFTPSGLLTKGLPTSHTSYLGSSVNGINGSSIQWSTKYYDTGVIYKKIDARGNPTTFNYQSDGTLVSSVVNALNQPISFGYDANTGVVTSETDSNTQTTRYGYDVLNRLIRVDFPDSGWRTFAINDQTLQVEDTKAQGTSAMSSLEALTVGMTYSYDGWGRLLRKLGSDSQGAFALDIGYDLLGRVKSQSNPYRTTDTPPYPAATTIYDGLNRPILLMEPDGNTQQWHYVGPTVITNDEAQNQWSRTSDALGRLTKVLEPGGLETDYRYDSLSNLQQVVQWGGQAGATTAIPCMGPFGYSTSPRVRCFTYDSLSRLISSSNPETGTICYGVWSGGLPGTGNCQNGYDLNGNVIAKTDARGVATSYVYDVLNRLTFQYHSDGSPNQAFGYDGNDEFSHPLPGVSNAVGRLDHISNDINVASNFSYDVRGRMTGRWECLATDCSYQTHTVAGYDLAGNMTSMTYPDGRQVVQAFDGAGRLSTVSSNGTTYIGGLAGGAISYTAAGAEQSLLLGNGVVQNNTFNNRLQPCHISVSSPILTVNPNIGNLLDRQSFYNQAASSPCGNEAANNGNIFAVIDNLHVGWSQAFQYDPLNRLTYASRSDGGYNHTYNYDPFGNMTLHDNLNPNNMDLEIDPARNQLLRNPVAGVTDIYGHPFNDLQYDLAGNMVLSGPSVAGGHALAYNADSQVVSVDGGNVATYIYSAAGDRAFKSIPGGTTDYVYFNGQPIAEKDHNGNWTDYIYANGRKIAMEKPWQAIWIHGANGSPGEGMVTIAMPSITISAGDHLNWYQSQQSSGGTVGGMNLVFENGWQLNGSCTSCTGQPVAAVDQNGVATDQWNGNFAGEYRSVDLSAYAGHTITQGQALKTPNAPYGSWDLTFSLISISHADGHVDSIYDGINPVGLGEVDDPSICCNWAGYVGAGNLTHYYIDDHLGTSQIELTAGGYPMWQGQFMPFGGELSDGQALNHYKFTGKERDTESGLDYFGARYYASNMGRWMSPDPIKMTKDRLADPQQMNLYNYGRNNPLSYIDADGRDINLVNDTAEGRAAALAKLTQGMSKAEAANIGMRQDKSGNWETYVKDPGAVSSKDASVGYKGITGVINDHSVTVSLGLVGGGLTATFGDLGKVSSIGGDQTLGATGDRNVSVVINQGDAAGCCEVSTPYGRMRGSEPDFVAMFHEVAGETLKYRAGHFSLQMNPDLDSRTVINIENKFRNSLGMYPRTGSDHGATSVTVTADGK